MKNSEKLKNKRSLILIATVLIGVISTNLNLENPDGYPVLLSGKRSSHTYDYYYWFIFSFIIGLVKTSGFLIKEPPTFIDKVTTITYIFFSALSMIYYLCYGWPEPKMYIVFAFFTSTIIYICLIIYQNGRTCGN